MSRVVDLQSSSLMTSPSSTSSRRYDGTDVLPDVSEMDGEALLKFVRAAHGEASRARNERRAALLREELRIGRDAALLGKRTPPSSSAASASVGGGERRRRGAGRPTEDEEEARSRAAAARSFPRLPSNGAPPPPALASVLRLPRPDPDGASSPSRSDPVDDGAAAAGGRAGAEEGTSGDEDGGGRGGRILRSASSASSPTLGPSVSVKIRSSSASGKNKWGPSLSVRPSPVEGTHPPLPKSSATIFLRTHYATEDEERLTYVPYFGDDDREDVVSDVYDLESRRRIVEFGSECQERDAYEVMDETLRLLRERVGGTTIKNEEEEAGEAGDAEEGGDGEGKKKKKEGDDDVASAVIGDVQRRINDALAEVMNVDPDRVAERYRACFFPPPRAEERAAEGTEEDGDIDDDETAPSSDKEGEEDGDDKTASSSTKTKKIPRNSETSEPLPYEELMDSYRNLFCRRCFTYDCNMHGNLTKPSLDLMGELAVSKEKEGHWDQMKKLPGEEEILKKMAPENESESESDKKDVDRESSSDGGGAESPNKNGRKRSRSSSRSSASPSKSQRRPRRALTPLQKSVCERAYLIFQGDVDKIAFAVDADRDAVARYVSDQSMELKEPTHVRIEPESKRGGDDQRKTKKKVKKKKKQKGADHTSMKNYNAAWLKRVEDAEIHPFFVPCDHDGPCSDDSCSCVKNAFFCTKHCVWGDKSRNFFRGCACKGNKCRTKSCACFAAKRECDPDLCRTCGAGTDPPNRPASKQMCRNDNIGMRRHCHLLLGQSTIPDAGWGIYTKSALKKGDYVHEYVGEVISQEEAERRGRIYDKVNRSYLFNLCSDYVVDASRKGNKTKFANHSSKPNCCTKMVNVNGDIRIGLFAKEDIEPQSELFFDYRYDVELDNDLIIKAAKTVDWMKNPKMANKISKKYA